MTRDDIDRVLAIEQASFAMPWSRNLFIVRLQRQGIMVGIITGRRSDLVRRRAAELGITEVHQNLENKHEAYELIKKKHGLSDSALAYIGDDEPDLPVLKKVGFSAAPIDAVEIVRRSVDYVCRRRGGEGTVREVVDMILRSLAVAKR